MAVAAVIDLRSETAAPFTSAVREAMATAPVGIDSYDEDKSVHSLESFAAELFGMKQALFVPTGRLANTIAIALHCPHDGEVLLDAWSHLLRAEYASVSTLLGRQVRTYGTRGGLVDVDEVLSLVRTSHTSRPTRLVAVEDPHLQSHGKPQSIDSIERLANGLSAWNVSTYLDGARIWYSVAESGVPLTTYGRLFDCLSVSLVKGPGAPVGAVCLFKDERRSEAIELRRAMGGAWARPGPLAKAAEVALRERLDCFGDDCQRARHFASLLVERLGDSRVVQATNMVSVRVIDSSDFFERCAGLGVLLFRTSPTGVRAVLHQGITDADLTVAATAIAKVAFETSA